MAMDNPYNDPVTVKVGKVEPTGEPCEEFFPGPCSVVIFGATGDLTHRKLIPSFFKLFRNGMVSKDFFIAGASRSKLDDAAFRAEAERALREAGIYDEKQWKEFSRRLFYRPLDFSASSSEAFKVFLAEKEKEFSTGGNRIFYLATPPSAYEGVVSAIRSSGLVEGPGWRRVVIEKPYGRDLKSARALDETVHANFREQDVFRIDHYLGKETVQNILMLRFANAIFEPIWNRRYIDHVQITVAESLGIGKRAGFYEQAGVLRDIFQNHMLQVLAFIAMEPPSVYESRLVSDEKVKVIRALRPMTFERLQDHLVLGQYVAGEIGGKDVHGYRGEEGVAKNSMTPTFAAIKVYIDNWRWQGVPFYLRSGKRMKNTFSQVTIQFKSVPHSLFRNTLPGEIGPNALVLRIQPDERVQMRFHTKNPGSKVCLRDVIMDFSYKEGYEGVELDAYERVLMDCILGDKMLFVGSEGVELSWSFLAPVLDTIEKDLPGSPELNLYRAGTWGPTEAERLIQKDGRNWVNYE